MQHHVLMDRKMSTITLPVEGGRKATIPFLIGRSTSRSSGPSLPGRYCADEKVWVVDGEDGIEPLVTSSEDILEIATKTATSRETDDNHAPALLAAITKTSAQLERDDDDIFASSRRHALLELTTKTEAQRERDD